MLTCIIIASQTFTLDRKFTKWVSGTLNLADFLSQKNTLTLT